MTHPSFFPAGGQYNKPYGLAEQPDRHLPNSSESVEPECLHHEAQAKSFKSTSLKVTVQSVPNGLHFNLRNTNRPMIEQQTHLTNAL